MPHRRPQYQGPALRAGKFFANSDRRLLGSRSSCAIANHTKPQGDLHGENGKETQHRRLFRGGLKVVQQLLLLDQPVQAIVAEALGADEPAQREGLNLARQAALVVDLAHVQLNRRMVLGRDQTVGGGAAQVQRVDGEVQQGGTGSRMKANEGQSTN